jgi:purine-binding chemotaxis protein CheW
LAVAGLEKKVGKYLTFRLQMEEYGLEILKVQEIMGMMKVTHIPKTPDFIRGVLNLRGKVIPVLELRRKFGMDSQKDDEKTCIIVVRLQDQDSITMGLIVDEVSEVLDIKDEQIEPPPQFGSSINTDFILGMGKIGDKVVSLLDIDQVLTGEEISILSKTTKVSKDLKE